MAITITIPTPSIPWRKISPGNFPFIQKIRCKLHRKAANNFKAVGDYYDHLANQEELRYAAENGTRP